MFPAGELVRALATATAFLTVVTGVPRVQCVCPDGRVKFSCPGPSTSDCCCVAPSTPGATGSETTGGRTDTASPGCCPRAKAERRAHPSGNERAEAGPPCRCERMFVADVLAPAAETDDGDPDTSGTVAVWIGCPHRSNSPAHSGRVEPRFLPSPFDRVVVFCHFTC